MQYPVIGGQLLSNLRPVQAFCNTSIMLLFFYHGRDAGDEGRCTRRAQASLPFPVIKRHRKIEPILVMPGMPGYCIGLTLFLPGTGNVLEYPSHFITGSFFGIFLITTFVISRKIKGQASPVRTPHFSRMV